MTTIDDADCWNVHPGASSEEMLQVLQTSNKLNGITIKRTRDNNESISVSNWWRDRNWIPFLEAIKGQDEIAKLQLKEVDLDHKSVSVLIQLLMEQKRIWKRVEMLNCRFQDSWCASSLLTAMAHNVESIFFCVESVLHGQHVFNVDVCMLTLGTVLAVSPRLHVLDCDLQKYEGPLAPEAMAHIADGICASRTLAHVDISGFHLSYHYEVGGGTQPLVAAFTRAFRQTRAPIDSVRLVKCGLNCQSTEAIISSLQHLENLNFLSFELASCHGCGFVSLGPIMRKSSLETLYLSQMASPGGRKIDIAYLMDCLKTNDSVSDLWLGGNRLNNEDAQLIVSMLLVNKTLKWLWLGNNSISDEGILLFAKHLPQMQGLRHLHLQKNPMTAAGASALRRSIKHLTSITWLGVSGGSEERNNGNDQNIMKEIQAEVENYAILNAGGRRLMMDPGMENSNPPSCPTLNASLWPYVLARVNGKDWLKPHGVQLDYASASIKVIHYFVQRVIPVLVQPRRQIKDAECGKKRRALGAENLPAAVGRQILQKKRRPNAS